MKTKVIDDKQYVFDAIRKKWLLFTPEEKVRQQMVQYLQQVKKVPTSVIALEKSITINGQQRRFDIVVYKIDKPWLLIECKEPSVTLNDATIQQVLLYNQFLQVSFISITNGQDLLVWQIDNQEFIQLNDIPFWE